MQNVFRSKKEPSSPPVIQPSLTINISEDERDESEVKLFSCPSTTSSGSMSSRCFSFARAEMLTEGVYLAHAKAIEKKEQEICDLRQVMEELEELHEEMLAVKDEEITATKIQLCFIKEDFATMERELELARNIVDKRDEALIISKYILVEKEVELSKIKSAWSVTKDSLNTVSSTLMANQYTLQERDEEISALKKSMVSGKRSAQVIAGLLTLGALCSSSDP